MPCHVCFVGDERTELRAQTQALGDVGPLRASCRTRGAPQPEREGSRRGNPHESRPSLARDREAVGGEQHLAWPVGHERQAPPMPAGAPRLRQDWAHTHVPVPRRQSPVAGMPDRVWSELKPGARADAPRAQSPQTRTAPLAQQPERPGALSALQTAKEVEQALTAETAGHREPLRTPLFRHSAGQSLSFSLRERERPATGTPHSSLVPPATAVLHSNYWTVKTTAHC